MGGMLDVATEQERRRVVTLGAGIRPTVIEQRRKQWASSILRRASVLSVEGKQLKCLWGGTGGTCLDLKGRAGVVR